MVSTFHILKMGQIIPHRCRFEQNIFRRSSLSEIHVFRTASLNICESSSFIIIRIIKSRRIDLAGHVARMGEKRKLIDYWWESQRERDHWEGQDVGGWIILRGILERLDGVMWTGLVWLRIGTGGELL
jgi:hypothetical protein